MNLNHDLIQRRISKKYLKISLKRDLGEGRRQLIILFKASFFFIQPPQAALTFYHMKLLWCKLHSLTHLL